MQLENMSIKIYTILYNFIQFYTILYNFIQFYTILYNFIQTTVLLALFYYCQQFLIEFKLFNARRYCVVLKRTRCSEQWDRRLGLSH